MIYLLDQAHTMVTREGRKTDFITPRKLKINAENVHLISEQYFISEEQYISFVCTTYLVTVL